MVRNIDSFGNPAAAEGAVISGERYRFTVLTPALIRMEYSEAGFFEDRATQTVMNRAFPVPAFHAEETKDLVTVDTEFLHLEYRKEEFAWESLKIRVLVNPETGEHRIWHFGDEVRDLKGTARTLDAINGALPLENGLVSREGFSLIDDSRTMVITVDGWVEPRGENGLDLYFFGYGRRYAECIRDFYRLCGRTPLIPRWALGNWWSRYHKYTEDEYRELIERFRRERLPFTVAVIDMDWHLVDIPQKYGSGWTGYTWNRELFPDPPRFLDWLHQQGLKVTLNVHPADGVRPHEEAYRRMAEAVGIDPDSEEPVEFDVTNRTFFEAYFDVLHHPMEDDGVDFWWVDWQQGTRTKIPGLDPLWMLNHYHYLDSRRNGKAGLTFSRYAEIGSHRYPIGFSGDTIISWESLDFQPYFTATASNVGYGWWSHDIGGHMMGVRDDELAVRWLQFGVFSPINRLHSTSNPFGGKEPWNFNRRAEGIMGAYLRLRHQLIPYLYTMNRIASRDGSPLIRPLYWEEPELPEAYEHPNEYYYGSELLALPITEKMDREAELAKVSAWIPGGLWFDCQNYRIYRGRRTMNLYRTLEEMPVLAKAGAILVKSLEETNDAGNPARLEADIFPGKSGCFTLWEDDGENGGDRDEAWVQTVLELKWERPFRFVLHRAEGNTGALPEKRSWKLCFCNIEMMPVNVTVGGAAAEPSVSYNREKKMMIVELEELPAADEVEIRMEREPEIAGPDKECQIFKLLNRAQISYDCKAAILETVKLPESAAILKLQAMNLNPLVFGGLMEILFCDAG